MSQNLVDGKYLNDRSIHGVKLTLGEPQFNWGRVITSTWAGRLGLEELRASGSLDESGTLKEVRIVD